MVTPHLRVFFVVCANKILDTLRCPLCELRQKEFNCGRVLEGNSTTYLKFHFLQHNLGESHHGKLDRTVSLESPE